jgi:hypothetical protein
MIYVENSEGKARSGAQRRRSQVSQLMHRRTPHSTIMTSGNLFYYQDRNTTPGTYLGLGYP